MPSRSVLGLAAMVVGTLGVVLGACGKEPDDTARGSASANTRGAFHRNAVLDDKWLKDSEAMSVEDVQQFLDKTPWGTRSALATYREDGKSAAAIMHGAATRHGINPLELLV